jgi:hypothetical protein
MGEPGDLTLAVPVRRVGIVCAVVIAALALGHFVFTVGQLPGKSIFDLDEESGVGTWVNSMLLVAPGVVAFVVAAARRRRGLSWVAIAVFGAVVVLLGVEEVAAFHERVSGKLSSDPTARDAIEKGISKEGLLVLPIVIIGLVLVGSALAPRARRLFVAGTVVWYGATFGIEQVEAWNHQDKFASIGAIPTLDRVIAGTQETLEMTGAALVLVALLTQLSILGYRYVFEVRTRADADGDAGLRTQSRGADGPAVTR